MREYWKDQDSRDISIIELSPEEAEKLGIHKELSKSDGHFIKDGGALDYTVEYILVDDKYLHLMADEFDKKVNSLFSEWKSHLYYERWPEMPNLQEDIKTELQLWKFATSVDKPLDSEPERTNLDAEKSSNLALVHKGYLHVKTYGVQPFESRVIRGINKQPYGIAGAKLKEWLMALVEHLDNTSYTHQELDNFWVGHPNPNEQDAGRRLRYNLTYRQAAMLIKYEKRHLQDPRSDPEHEAKKLAKTYCNKQVNSAGQQLHDMFIALRLDMDFYQNLISKAVDDPRQLASVKWAIKNLKTIIPLISDEFRSVAEQHLIYVSSEYESLRK